MSTYHLEVAGPSRELPICKISDKLSIAAFIMLGDPELPINVIAVKTGFADRYHFSKAFKAFFGISPAAMRKKLIADKND